MKPTLATGRWRIQHDLFGGTPTFWLTCPRCSRSWKFFPTGLADDPRTFAVVRRCPHCKAKVMYAPQG